MDGSAGPLATTQDPWTVAHQAARRARTRIEPLRTMADAEHASALVTAVWGEEVLEPSLVRAFQHAGSVTLAAWDGDRMVGFVLGFVGMDGGMHLHSHILGVEADRQNGGVGRALKIAQRAAALDLGIDEIRWTFDPMVARNARFNLVALGAVATRFLPGFYGHMRDVVNRGDRSDRFEVRWSLRSDRVTRAVEGRPREPARDGGRVLEPGPDGEPRPSATGPSSGASVSVLIPTDYHDLRRRDPDLADRWRDASRSAFEACYQAGLAGMWFSKEHGYRFEPPGER